MKILNYLRQINLKYKIILFFPALSLLLFAGHRVPASQAGPVNTFQASFTELQWKLFPLKSHASFRSMALAGSKAIWASGSGATWIRSVNGGKSWDEHTFGGADSVLDFRGIAALNDMSAWLMSSGESENGLARIFSTVNGGNTWTQQYKASTPGIFLDGIQFWDRSHGICFGDPVQGHFFILLTHDGGQHWKQASMAASPAANGLEGAFAASGTSLAIRPGGIAWIATGGSGGARVFRSIDYGQSWAISATPLKTGTAAGIFGLCFISDHQGIALGGDYLRIHEHENNAAVTSDGGQTWLPAQTEPSGLREAAVFFSARHLLVAVGPSGTSTSADSGRNWAQHDTLAFHTLAGRKGEIWAAGGHGQLGELEYSTR